MLINEKNMDGVENFGPHIQDEGRDKWDLTDS